MSEAELLNRIRNLEKLIDRLPEQGGIWTSWTPVITYSGGSTDPTSLTTSSARYSVIGEICHVFIAATLVRGSGDRTQTQFTLPKNYTINFSGSAVITYVSGSNAWRAYGSGSSKIVIDHGAMTGNGIIYVSAFYEF